MHHLGFCALPLLAIPVSFLLHVKYLLLYCIPRRHTELARRAFSVAATFSLPKRHLKTSLYSTHLVLLSYMKRLCIFGPKCAIQISYYYYFLYPRYVIIVINIGAHEDK